MSRENIFFDFEKSCFFKFLFWKLQQQLEIWQGGNPENIAHFVIHVKICPKKVS